MEQAASDNRPAKLLLIKNTHFQSIVERDTCGLLTEHILQSNLVITMLDTGTAAVMTTRIPYGNARCRWFRSEHSRDQLKRLATRRKY